MNNITIEQNTRKQINRLAAQRQLYATAKKIFGWQIFISGPITILTALLVIFFPNFKGYIALWGFGVALSDLFWLTPWQKRLKDSAARIQEAFDCDVLELPWNSLKAGKKPDPELVNEEAAKHKKWEAKMPPLSDWYSVEVAELPLHVARIACQRSNCWWDSKQRRRYAASIITSVLLVLVAVVMIAMIGNLSMEDITLKIAAPLFPCLLLGVRQFREQTEAATRLDKLKEFSETVWNQALGRKAKADLAALSRNLQDEIFENRRKSPLVFDQIFKRLRDDYEIQMNRGVADYVEEAKKRLKHKEA